MLNQDLSGELEFVVEDFKAACQHYHGLSGGRFLFTPSQSDCLEFAIRNRRPGYLYMFTSAAQRDALVKGGYFPALAISKPRHTTIYVTIYSRQKLSALEREIFMIRG